jgi:hypothetical protein
MTTTNRQLLLTEAQKFGLQNYTDLKTFDLNNIIYYLKNNLTMKAHPKNPTEKNLCVTFAIAKDGNNTVHFLKCIHNSQTNNPLIAPRWCELFTYQWIESEDGSLWQMIW